MGIHPEVPWRIFWNAFLCEIFQTLSKYLSKVFCCHFSGIFRNSSIFIEFVNLLKFLQEFLCYSIMESKHFSKKSILLEILITYPGIPQNLSNYKGFRLHGFSEKKTEDFLWEIFLERWQLYFSEDFFFRNPQSKDSRNF